MSTCINPNCPKPNNTTTQLFCSSCSSELLLAGRYRVTRQLGSGGFAKTYEVSDRNGSPKVLKVLTNNHSKYVELFQREAEILSRLEHQGIPRVEPDAYFTFLPRQGQILHCLVMEKIYGMDLQQYLQMRASPIDQKLALQWLIQLAHILREVHNHNFFHRDIKPSNIMLRADGPLVLIDFGTAREISGSFVVKQAAGQITGVMSAGYTPPEQLNGQSVPQSDFFALGRTFVYLLTGKDPNHFYDPYTDELHWRNESSEVLPEFADFIDRLMARFPNQRPQTAEVVLHQLIEIESSLSTSAERHSKAKVLTNSPQPATGQQQSLATSPTVKASSSHPVWNSSTPFSSKVPPTPSQIEPDFLSRCQKELAQLIGPMSSILCKRILNQNPTISAQELVETLAKRIPDHQQAEKFRRRLLF